MLRLKVENINNFEYELTDENREEYNINIELIDVEDSIDIGDYIHIEEILLNPEYEGYSSNYLFGYLDNKYGRENLAFGNIDIIKIEKEDEEILLKRLYG